MSEPTATSAWLAERQRDRIRGAEKLSAAWFADRDEDVREILPSLEFNTPECPICLESTMFDDDVFICEVCGVVWPRSGYGQDAEIQEGGIGWAFIPTQSGSRGFQMDCDECRRITVQENDNEPTPCPAHSGSGESDDAE